MQLFLRNTRPAFIVSLLGLMLSGCGLDPDFDIDAGFNDTKAPYPKLQPLDVETDSAEPRLDETSVAAHEARAARLRRKAQALLAMPVER